MVSISGGTAGNSKSKREGDCIRLLLIILFYVIKSYNTKSYEVFRRTGISKLFQCVQYQPKIPEFLSLRRGDRGSSKQTIPELGVFKGSCNGEVP